MLNKYLDIWQENDLYFSAAEYNKINTTEPLNSSAKTAQPLGDDLQMLGYKLHHQTPDKDIFSDGNTLCLISWSSGATLYWH